MDNKELKEIMADHDLLIEMNTLLNRLITDHENHLHHHWMINVAMLSITFMSITTVLIALFIK